MKPQSGVTSMLAMGQGESGWITNRVFRRSSWENLIKNWWIVYWEKPSSAPPTCIFFETDSHASCVMGGRRGQEETELLASLRMDEEISTSMNNPKQVLRTCWTYKKTPWAYNFRSWALDFKVSGLKCVVQRALVVRLWHHQRGLFRACFIQRHDEHNEKSDSHQKTLGQHG